MSEACNMAIPPVRNPKAFVVGHSDQVKSFLTSQKTPKCLLLLVYERATQRSVTILEKLPTCPFSAQQESKEARRLKTGVHAIQWMTLDILGADKVNVNWGKRGASCIRSEKDFTFW